METKHKAQEATLEKEIQELKEALEKGFRRAFGLYWDEDNNPVCPFCDMPLRPDRVEHEMIRTIKAISGIGPNPLEPKPKLNCLSM